MRKSKEHFRHEWKYLINRAEKQLTDLRLRECMQLDPHAGEGGYMIRSLYFDDYWNSAMEEKDAGVLMRKKYRIRIYNCSDKSIKLERKKKFGSYIYKEAAPLTRPGSRSGSWMEIRIFAAQFLSFMQGILHRVCLQYDASKGDRRL